MRELPITASDEEIKQVVYEWIDLLAQGRFDDAVAMLSPEFVHDNHYVSAEEPQVWTGALVETLIHNYGSFWGGFWDSDEQKQHGIFKVIAPDESFQQLFEVYRNPLELAGQVYSCRVDAPLTLEDEQGEQFDDLTALLCLREISDSKLVLHLDNIHML